MKYDYESSEQFTSFEFQSVGPKGTILKRVQFIRLENAVLKGLSKGRAVFHLAFGDVLATTNEIDDLAVTHNGDTEKVLATVASTIYQFFEHYPLALLLFEGSTKARTRLYRMGISKYFDQLSIDFQIMGYENGNWRNFATGFEYNAFLVSRKSINFANRL